MRKIQSKFKKNVINTMIGSLVPIIVLVFWQIGINSGYLPKSIIASPLKVLSNFFILILDNTLLFNILQSLHRIIPGFIIGSLLGIILGILTSSVDIFKKLLNPFLLVLIPVPPLAWIPMLIIFFGTDDGVKIALISTGCLGTLFLATSHGVNITEKKYHELIKIYKKNWFESVWQIFLPSASPQIFSSLRVAMALSWTLLMASEMIKSSSGIGWFINDARNFSRPDDLIVAIITVVILGKMSDSLILFLDKKINSWREINN